MPPFARAVFSTIFSIAALSLFAILYLIEIWQAWKGKAPATSNDVRTYLATGVSGLVTAIVATSLSVSIPAAEQTRQPGGQGKSPAVTTVRRIANQPSKSNNPQNSSLPSNAINSDNINEEAISVEDLGNTVAGVAASDTIKQTLAVIYASVYTFIGLAAIIVWIFRDNISPMVKNLAVIFFGLILAAAKTFIAA